MDTSNFGKIKVGIDWEDKGWVSFGQDTYNTDNVLSNARFFDTQLGSFVGGDATKKQNIVPLGLYGLENVNIDFTPVGGTYTLGSHPLDGIYTIPVTPSTDYVFWYWVSASDDYTNDGDHTFQAGIFQYDSSNVASGNNVVAVDFTGDNLVVARYIDFTTNPDTTHIRLQFLKSDIDFSNLRIVLYGVFLNTGTSTTEPIWGNGEGVPDTIIDNNITSYVLQAQGSIGKSTWETILFDEGQLTLTLNNQDRRFSPEYADGEYYTYLRPYRRVWVSAQDSDGVYKLLWAGWTHQFALNTGNKKDRQATITARQGKYNIEAQDPDNLVAVADQLSVYLIQNLFSGGYVIPSQSGDETTTSITIIKSYEAGVNVPIFGADFVENKDKKYLTELEHVAELNGNYIFLTREGRIVFKTYESVKAEIPEELPYSLTKNMHYVYSPSDLYKQIVVNYTHYDYADDIEMQGQDVILASGSVDFPFDVHPQYNGMPLIGEVVLDVSSFLPTDYNTTPSMGTANSAFTEVDEGLYTWYVGLAQNSTDLDYRLSLISRDSGNVWYAKEINQQYIVAGVTDIALDTLTYNNPLITNETMAEDFANMQINRRASIVSWFDSAEFENKTAEAVTWMLDHSVGDVVYSQEEQSGDIPKHLIIIGEQFTYTPAYLRLQYNIAPTGAEVDVAAFTYEVNGQNVDFNNESIVSDTPTWLWDFGA